MSETTYIVKLNGFGHKNGNVAINKVLEFDNVNEYQQFLGPNKLNEISRVISFHYPNVDFDPKKISISTNSIKKQKPKKESNTLLAGTLLAGKMIDNREKNQSDNKNNLRDLRRLESKKRSNERIKARRENKKDNRKNILENETFKTLFNNPSQKKGVNKLIPVAGLILMFLILLLILWIRKN